MIDIKTRRIELGLSLKHVADEVGVDRSTVMRWENGKTEIKIEKAAKLAEVLQLPLERLLSKQQQTPDCAVCDYGYVRVASCVPDVDVSGVHKNVETAIGMIRKCRDADIIVFPELSVTGYTCADLFLQKSLFLDVKEGIAKLLAACKDNSSVVFIGAPLQLKGQLYNCAVAILCGKIIGIIPKTFLPNYGEFYEKRWFSSSLDALFTAVSSSELGIADEYEIPFGSDIIFNINGRYTLAAEICEDLWTPLPPSTILFLSGAEIVVNLSASNETIGKGNYREMTVNQQSARCIGAYAYTSAGVTESTTDIVFSGRTVFSERGIVVEKNKKQLDSNYTLTADFDLEKIRADRLKNKSFKDAARVYCKAAPRIIDINSKIKHTPSDGSLRSVKKLPFVPDSRTDRIERCMEIFNIQVAGLKKRMQVTGGAPVIGISGGLDSTLALLVSAQAAKECRLPLERVTGITMPGFGTTDRTYLNSLELMRTMGVKNVEISIKDAVLGHFEDIGHDKRVLDLTYENSQARERTQILMDYAGEHGGFVVGTGDLSELALGWCTYNADQMSMYGVNASVPKTLIRWMIEAIVESGLFKESKSVLMDVLDTPISPELLPPDADGNIAQRTEDLVGPYALHDFYLYYVLRFGFEPEKIYMLACRAFEGDFDADTIKKWLVSFYRRFFSQQFKRSCMPDGVKVGSVGLSPRGDWRMPSDATAADWIKRAESL